MSTQHANQLAQPLGYAALAPQVDFDWDIDLLSFLENGIPPMDISDMLEADRAMYGPISRGMETALPGPSALPSTEEMQPLVGPAPGLGDATPVLIVPTGPTSSPEAAQSPDSPDEGVGATTEGWAHPDEGGPAQSPDSPDEGVWDSFPQQLGELERSLGCTLLPGVIADGFLYPVVRSLDLQADRFPTAAQTQALLEQLLAKADAKKYGQDKAGFFPSCGTIAKILADFDALDSLDPGRRYKIRHTYCRKNPGNRVCKKLAERGVGATGKKRTRAVDDGALLSQTLQPQQRDGSWPANLSQPTPSTPSQGCSPGKYLYMVPLESAHAVLTWAHHQTDHGGRDKTYHFVRQQNLSTDGLTKELVGKWVALCPLCSPKKSKAAAAVAAARARVASTTPAP